MGSPLRFPLSLPEFKVGSMEGASIRTDEASAHLQDFWLASQYAGRTRVIATSSQ